MHRFAWLGRSTLRNACGTRHAGVGFPAFHQLVRNRSSQSRRTQFRNKLATSRCENQKLPRASAKYSKWRGEPRNWTTTFHDSILDAVNAKDPETLIQTLQAATRAPRFRPNTTTRRLLVPVMRELVQAQKYSQAVQLFIVARQLHLNFGSSWLLTVLKGSIASCCIEDVIRLAKEAHQMPSIDTSRINELIAEPLIIAGHAQMMEKFTAVEFASLLPSSQLIEAVCRGITVRLICATRLSEGEYYALMNMKQQLRKQIMVSGQSAELIRLADNVLTFADDYPKLFYYGVSSPMDAIVDDNEVTRTAASGFAGGARVLPNELAQILRQTDDSPHQFNWVPVDQQTLRKMPVCDIQDQLLNSSRYIMFHKDLASNLWQWKDGMNSAFDNTHTDVDEGASRSVEIFVMDPGSDSMDTAQMVIAIRVPDMGDQLFKYGDDDSYINDGYYAEDDDEDYDEEEDDDDDDDDDSDDELSDEEDEDDDDEDGDDENDALAVQQLTQLLKANLSSHMENWNGCTELHRRFTDVSENVRQNRSVKLHINSNVFQALGMWKVQ